MTDEQKAAYVFSQSVVAQIEMEAMKADNAYRAAENMAPAWNYDHFMDVINRYNLGSNDVLGVFHG